MIGLSWLLPLGIIGPMFSPKMANQDIWDVNTLQCHPPSGPDDKPWILYVGILAFILLFTALIVLQVLVLIKRQESMETALNRCEKKVTTVSVVRVYICFLFSFIPSLLTSKWSACFNASASSKVVVDIKIKVIFCQMASEQLNGLMLRAEETLALMNKEKLKQRK